MFFPVGTQKVLQTYKCLLSGTQAVLVLHHSGHLRKRESRSAVGDAGGIRKLLAARESQESVCLDEA